MKLDELMRILKGCSKSELGPYSVGPRIPSWLIRCTVEFLSELASRRASATEQGEEALEIKPRPTIAELEAILNSTEERRIEIQPNGEVRAVPMKVEQDLRAQLAEAQDQLAACAAGPWMKPDPGQMKDGRLYLLKSRPDGGYYVDRWWSDGSWAAAARGMPYECAELRNTAAPEAKP